MVIKILTDNDDLWVTFVLVLPYRTLLQPSRRFALMLLCALRVLKLVISGTGSVVESFESGEVHANAWNK